ncbi:hypothetical protein K8I61_11925 [bacterium]|nr:hypothetical protein [bacterium]
MALTLPKTKIMDAKKTAGTRSREMRLPNPSEIERELGAPAAEETVMPEILARGAAALTLGALFAVLAWAAVTRLPAAVSELITRLLG